MPYTVIQRTEASTEIKAIKMGKVPRYFENGQFSIDDRAEANDIRDEFGQNGAGEVLVARVPDHTTGKMYAIRVPWKE